MIRKLLVVFVSGLLIAVVSLSAAWVVGGERLVTHLKAKGALDMDDDDPQATRNFAFDGKQIMTIDGAIDLRFVRGAKSEMIISGPEKLLNQLDWQNGRLSRKGGKSGFDGGIEIEITAPEIKGLVLRGAGDIDLEDLDQAEFSIDSAGAVDLSARGKLDKLTIRTRGASDLDFSQVEARDATLHIEGAGDVDIAASGDVDARIKGAGEVELHSKPKNLTSSIAGAGSIINSY